MIDQTPMMDTESHDEMSPFFVKGLFRWYNVKSNETSAIEERIILCYAKDFDDAIAKSIEESSVYCVQGKSADFAIEAIGWWDAFQPAESNLVDGVEIYSRLMDTSLSAASFLKRYYPKSQIHRAPGATSV